MAGTPDNTPRDGRAKAQLYNAGLTVKDHDNDIFEYAEAILEGKQPDYVPGFLQRELMAFHLPNVGIVEMYINPQNFTITSKKHITEVRTKGGYVMQYWGEALDEIQISGTTGSAGIEGINILRDIYRSEHKTFSSVNTALINQLSGSFNSLLANATSQSSFGRELSKWLNINASVRPTLASLASAVTLIFQGVYYKGYFKGFVVRERAEQPGLFDYDMSFTSYDRRGSRSNFMPWHRSPYVGPADSNNFSPNFSTLSNSGDSQRALNQLLNRNEEA